MNIGNLSGMYPNYALYANTNPINPSARATGSDTDLTAVDSLGKKEAHSTDPDKIKKAGKRSSPEECETCANRKYQDGSDEGNVSFKTASHVSPESAGARVRAHEGEHVSNAYKKAAQKNGKVVNASVSIHTSVCPECGRSYVSGGTTSTQIKYYNEENPYQKDLKTADGLKYRGNNINVAC